MPPQPLPPPLPLPEASRPPCPALQPDLDPKMRGRLEGKLEELKAAQAQHQRQELERKYAVRYHKASQGGGWRGEGGARMRGVLHLGARCNETGYRARLGSAALGWAPCLAKPPSPVHT